MKFWENIGEISKKNSVKNFLSCYHLKVKEIFEQIFGKIFWQNNFGNLLGNFFRNQFQKNNKICSETWENVSEIVAHKI